MKCRRRIVTVVLIFLALFSANLLAQTTAADETLAFKPISILRFEEAIQHFERCVALAPKNDVAHLYLATAYAQQYIPGVETPDNNRMAEQAIDQYQHVLDGNPVVPSARTSSAKGIAYLSLQMKKFDDAKKYYRMAADLDPDDPENYYSMGVIDWTQTYVPRREARARLGMKPDEFLPTNDKTVCAAMREKNTASVQEGIDNLNKALKLRPDYDDAMAYMNLMYRERADIQFAMTRQPARPI